MADEASRDLSEPVLDLMPDLVSDSVSDSVSDPGPARPDTADWTWVLERACPDCGFSSADLPVEGIGAVVRDAGARYAAVLGRSDVRTRPAEGVWSPLEYTCHVRDVCDVMRGRIEQILAGDGSTPVQFANWDQDATAVEKAYWSADPAVVSGEVAGAFEQAAVAFELPRGEQWSWRAIRSNGSVFTAETLGQYFVHDLRHHLWDVKG